MLVKSIKFTAQLVIYLFTFLIPRDKDLWIFSSWMGNKIADNPLAMYKYLHENTKCKVKCVWIVKNKKLHDGVTIFYVYSFRGILLQLRASVCVFTHSIQSEFLPYLISRNCYAVQTWHGTPLKKIGHLGDFKEESSAYTFLKKNVFAFRYSRMDIICAPTEQVATIFKRAFLLSDENVVLTGYPRYDFILPAEKKAGQTNIMYAPTFRPNSDFNLLVNDNLAIEELNEKLKTHDILLTVRLHPVEIVSKEHFNQVNQCSNIIFDNTDDLYENLSSYSLVITDYSSVMFDAKAIGIPVVLYPYDYDNYFNNGRGLYLDYKTIEGALVVESWSQLMVSVKNVGIDGFIAKYDASFLNQYSGKYDLKGNNSEQFFNLILNKLASR